MPDAANQRATTLESLRSASGPRLGIDPRALGAFRILLGALLLSDLAFVRLPGLGAFYTDDGVLPRSALAETYPTFATASLHAVSGSAWVQGALFAIAGCFALSLLVGYRTRLSAAVSLLLLASLHARNPYVVNGGDTILLTFLFLGLFLPLDARWALGASRSDGDRRVHSLGTAIILAHVVLIYVANAILKFRSGPWMGGTAVPRIFQLEEYVVGLGPYLAEYPALLTAGNWLWVALHVVAIFLLVYTGWPRTALVAAFVGFHLGMAATMRLGIFPFVMLAGLLLFLPSPVWNRADRVVRAVASRVGRPLASDGPFDRAGTDETEAGGPPATASLPPRGRRGLRAGSVAVLVAFFVSIALWQAAGVGLVDASPPDPDGELSEASWAFFAPNPPDASSWYVVEATLESGETVDAADGEAVTFDRPPDAAATYPTTLWHRYGSEMRFADESEYEPAAAYLCRQVDGDVGDVTIYHVQQPVDAEGPVGDPIANERITRSC